MATMQEIETKAKAHALAREKLTVLVTTLKKGMDALQNAQLPELKKAVIKAELTGNELLALVKESPKLFEKPKSVIFHGIKLGYKKEKGRIEFDDPQQVVELIRKHLPKLAKTLVITEETPAKKALNNLTAEQLKKIGVTVTKDSDVVFIAPVDSDVDKIVNALVKGAAEEVEA